MTDIDRSQALPKKKTRGTEKSALVRTMQEVLALCDSSSVLSACCPSPPCSDYDVHPLIFYSKSQISLEPTGVGWEDLT